MFAKQFLISLMNKFIGILFLQRTIIVLPGISLQISIFISISFPFFLLKLYKSVKDNISYMLFKSTSTFEKLSDNYQKPFHPSM